MNSYDIIERIAKAEKTTPVKVYVKGDLKDVDWNKNEFFGNSEWGVLFVQWTVFQEILKKNKDKIKSWRVENDRRNSAIPMADLKRYQARIEPGAIIRDMVEVGDNAVVMMGAVINIGAVIGEKTMIDMNVVIGGRAQIGNNCHIGAGAVIAGVIEPPSADPVRIEDDVLIGANAVVLEGVKIGKGSVVAAGAVVVKDVEPYTVVAGSPAKVLKKVDEKTKAKTQLMEELRNL